MAKSIMARSIQTLFFQLAGQGSSIVTGVVLARALGPEGKGIVGYAAIVLAAVCVFFDGQTEAVGYQFGKRKIPLHLVAATTAKIVAVLIPVLMAVLYGISQTGESQRIVVAAALALPFALVAQLCVPFMMFANQYTYANMQPLIVNLVYLALIVPTLFVFHGGPLEIVGVWIVSQAAGAAHGLYRVASIYRRSRADAARVAPEPAPSPLAVERVAEAAPVPGVAEASVAGAVAEAASSAHEEAAAVERTDEESAPVATPAGSLVREQMTFAAKSGFAAVAGFLNLRIDVFVVQNMLGNGMLGIYTLAIATGELMWQFSRALTWSAVGKIATLPKPEAAALVAKVTRHIFAFQCVLALLAAAFGPLFISLVYGKRFDEAGTALRYLLPGLVAYTMEGAMGYFISVQLGRPLLRMVIRGTSVVLCAIISILTIPHFSIKGAAIATSVSYLTVIAIVVAIFTRGGDVPLRDVFILRAEELARVREGARAKARKLLGRFGGARA